MPDIGRSLRRERTRQGLRLDELAASTGLPELQLEALEAGTVDRLPDQVETVRALRVYADALGLPGDQFALALVDHWPRGGVVAAPVVALPGTTVAAAGAVAATALVSAPYVPDPYTAPAPYESGYRPGDTGVVPADPPVPVDEAEEVTVSPAGSTVRRVGGTSVPQDPGTAQVPLIFADTGVTPAVPYNRPRRRSPLALRLLVALVALALLAGVAGLVIHKVRPQWLVDAGITTASHTTTNPDNPHHHHAPAPSIFALASHSSTSANFTVRSPYFLVSVVPVGGSSWVQVTNSQQVTPVFQGTVADKQTKEFLVGPNQSLTVSVGSADARVLVAVGKHEVGFYFPTVAPFTMHFRSVT